MGQYESVVFTNAALALLAALVGARRAGLALGMFLLALIIGLVLRIGLAVEMTSLAIMMVVPAMGTAIANFFMIAFIKAIDHPDHAALNAAVDDQSNLRQDEALVAKSAAKAEARAAAKARAKAENLPR